MSIETTIKGNLIYQMSDSLYESNRNNTIRKPIGLVLLIVFSIVLAVYMYVDDFLKGSYLVGLVTLFLFFYLIAMLKEPQYSKLTRFGIYENGFIPANKPVMYIIKRKEFFVSFSEIVNISFKRLGQDCSLDLQNRKRLYVSANVGDINGYKLFCNILRKYFPDVDFPDLDAVESFTTIKTKLSKDEVSLRDFNKVYEEIKTINRNFE